VKRLHILQVNKYYAPVIGGVERVVQELCEGLSARADVTVLVCNRRGKTMREVIKGVEVLRASSIGQLFSMPLSLSFVGHFRKIAKHADILQFHMPFPLGDVASLLSNHSGKVAIYWHSDIVRQKRLLKLYKPLMTAFLNRADVIFTATQGHVDGSAFLGSYAKKCVVVPYGIDADAQVRGANPDRMLKLTRPGMTHFLFVGRLVYYKGVDVLLRAAAKVENAQLSIIGDGPLCEELNALAMSLGIADRVAFHGGFDDAGVKACMRDCDALVLPSVHNSEAFGLVQLQAMSFSKPVINTLLPTGVPHVSLHEQTGLTVKPGDADELAAAMRRLADGPAYAAALGKAGAVRVRTAFTMQGMIEGIYAQYLRLMGG
jgi:rhamnosyl/mannosyltransferase